RLGLLEAKPDPVGTFKDLTDVSVDVVTDASSILYLGDDGKVRGSKVNPMLAMGYTPVQAGSVGFTSVISPSTIAAVTIAASPVIVMTADANRIATLPNVVPFNTVKPSTTEVRVGRVTYFVNASNVQKTLRVTSGQHFHKNGNMDTTNVIVPPKTTYIYNPAILDNGSGADLECFVFMGQVSHEDADMSTILAEFARIQDLHDGQQVEIDFLKAEQALGKLTVEGLQTITTDLVDRVNVIETTGHSFETLSDTPASYFGNAHKSLRVNTAADGLEFIDSPEVAILEALAGGNLPIKWNNMKQKIAATSGDITATAIADNAFTLGLGGTAGRKFLLPDIVDADTVPLPANSVREGRLTILSQQGGGSRTVELTAGCKFNSGGTSTTTSPTIMPGQAWILLPAIYGNGDRVWSIIGTFSANEKTPDLSKGYISISDKCVTSNMHQNSSQISQGTIATASMVSTSGGTNRTASLPEIVPFSYTGLLATTQVRQGKTITFWGSSTAKMVLAPHAGQKISRNGVVLDGNYTLDPKILETYTAIVLGGVGQWMLIGRCKLDGSPVELDEVNNRLAALEIGGGGGGGADVGPLIIRLDDHEDRIEALEAAGGSVDLKPITDRLEILEDMDLAPLTGRVTAVEGEVNDVDARVVLLENKPHPKFFDLTDTPSAGAPGKLIGFNMAGDAVTSYDRISNFTGLGDTPSNFNGSATKVLTVKTDESGLEFTPFPRLQPLQDAIDDLTTGVMDGFTQFSDVDDRLQVSIDGHETRLTTLEGASGGSGSSTFVGLTDTPDTLTANRILTVNAAGTGVDMSQATTDDLRGALMLADGVTTGDVLLHQNCLGAPCVMSGQDVVTATELVNSAVVLYAAWRNSNAVKLPKVAAYDASPLPLGHVRAGRMTSIYNRTGNAKSITVTVDATSTGVIIKDKTYTTISSITIAPGQVLKLMPTVDAGVQTWVVMEQYVCV
ncbi:MAG: hypothetical protein ACRC6V_04925, partial [Bacteroidales bacterium]